MSLSRFWRTCEIGRSGSREAFREQSTSSRYCTRENFSYIEQPCRFTAMKDAGESRSFTSILERSESKARQVPLGNFLDNSVSAVHTLAKSKELFWQC
jgi:hypothetical protein